MMIIVLFIIIFIVSIRVNKVNIFMEKFSIFIKKNVLINEIGMVIVGIKVEWKFCKNIYIIINISMNVLSSVFSIDCMEVLRKCDML